MERNILSEIDQIKYLFGYKAGKVISEQDQPKTPGTNVQPNNKLDVDLFTKLADAIKTKKVFIVSPRFPKNLIVPGEFEIIPSQYDGVSGNKQQGEISFTLLAPTPSKVVPGYGSIGFGISTEYEDQINSIDDALLYLKDGDLYVNEPKLQQLNPPPNPADMIEQLLAVFANGENAKVYLDFMKSLNPQAEQWFKDSLLKMANDTTTRYSDQDKKIAVQLLQSLFGQQTTK